MSIPPFNKVARAFLDDCAPTEPLDYARDTIGQMTEHLPTLRRYAASLTHDRANADDLLQNTLLRAIEKVNQFQRGTNLRAWLFSIMHHIFVDAFRKQKYRVQQLDDSAVLRRDELHVSPRQIPHIELHDLTKALDNLGPNQRSTLMLATLDGLDYDEIARITNAPLGTVRSRLSRARARVQRDLLGSYTNEQNPPSRSTRTSDQRAPPSASS